MYKWFCLGVIVLAFALRLINLSGLPSGFTPDEASFGYDAYSLIHSGKDQWGHAWPLTFKSFGDFKLPAYVYLTIPSITIFGMTEFAVRFPNALLGSFSVVITYFLALELCHKMSNKRYIALLSATFLAVSPWHVALSRGAFEANLTTFFLSLGVFFFLKSRRNDSFLPLAMLFFGINLFTYHSARIITPLVVISLLCLYRDDFPKRKKYVLASFTFLPLFILAIWTSINGASTRALTSTIFSTDLGSNIIKSALINAGMPSILAKLLYNQPFFVISRFLQNFGSYFSLGFLFTEGPRESTYGMVPGIGVVTLMELLGLILFTVKFIKKIEKETLFLFVWMLISPIPAALSIGPGNAANRAAIVMPAIQIIAAIGIFYLFVFVKTRVTKLLLPFVFILAIVFGLATFFRYAYEQPVKASSGMVYGMHEVFDYLKEYPDKTVVLSLSISEPHAFAQFYDQISPALSVEASKQWTLEERKINWIDELGTYYIGRYIVTSIQRTTYRENTLVVSGPSEIPEGIKVKTLKTIYTPDHKPILIITERDPNQ